MLLASTCMKHSLSDCIEDLSFSSLITRMEPNPRGCGMEVTEKR